MAMRDPEYDTDRVWDFKPHWVTLARPILLALLGLGLYKFGRDFAQSRAGMLETDRLLRGIEPMIGADGVKQLVKFAEPASIGLSFLCSVYPCSGRWPSGRRRSCAWTASKSSGEGASSRAT